MAINKGAYTGRYGVSQARAGKSGKVKVKTFERAGGALVNIIARKNNNFFLSLWRDLVKANPVDTGTSRNSWILTAGSPSPVKPPYQMYYGMPKEPDVWKYTWRWMNWYIVNNQPYVAGLNNGENPTKQVSPGWINSAVRRNTIISNSGGF